MSSLEPDLVQLRTIRDQDLVKGPFRDSSIVLRDLQPLREYCLRVQAHLLWKSQELSRPGRLSNVSCHETSADASTKLQRVVLVAVATFLSLAALAGACVFLILRFRGLIKHWFRSPPGIPAQIEEVRVLAPVGG
ncbi:Interferon gamma receptor 2 [Myotis brandtii]|uniref:Interferon gamma receptor 2 n=1 Tax=Myotis brandtii TaxID=109478 RepID=S7MIQ3_MYOBR|nr:Interferon gamma receptor 2 [Myotis brandtii]